MISRNNMGKLLNVYVEGYTFENYKVDDVYQKVLTLVNGFKSLENTNIEEDELIREYRSVTDKIHHLYDELKRDVFASWKIVDDFNIDYNMNISTFYKGLEKFKEDRNNIKFASSVVEYELRCMGGIENYDVLKEQVDLIKKETINNILNGVDSYDCIERFKNKIKYLEVLYIDFKRRANRLLLTDKKDEVNTWLLGLNKDYIKAQHKLTLFERQVYGNQKWIDALDAVNNMYEEKDYKLVKSMLDEIELIREKKQNSVILDSIISKKYNSLQEYKTDTSKYLEHDSIYVAKKKVPISYVLMIEENSDTYNLFAEDYLNGSMNCKKELIDEYFVKLNVFLRNNEFLGLSIKNSSDILLYSNGYLNICYNSASDTIFVTDTVLETEEVSSNIECFKFENEDILRQYMNGYLNSLKENYKKML